MELVIFNMKQILFICEENDSFKFSYMNKQRHISSLSPGRALAQLSPFSKHVLKLLVKVRLSEGTDRLQHGFSHRVPQLLEEHPEK